MKGTGERKWGCKGKRKEERKREREREWIGELRVGKAKPLFIWCQAFVKLAKRKKLSSH